MRRAPNVRVEQHRLMGPPGENIGMAIFRRGGVDLRVIFSDAEGWDHVSVSTEDRCPTWEEMCWIKDQFFDDEERVFQLHPKRSEYVNTHPFALHLWRCQTAEPPMPPLEMV